MGELAARRRALDAARARFAAGDRTTTAGRAARDGVADAITDIGADGVASWTRCRDRGAAAVSTVGAGDTSPQGDRSSAADGAVGAALEVTRPLLDELAGIAAGEGYIAAVTDAAGTIVWADGSPAMRSRASAADFVPGADWSERSAGTNAPGLSLVTDAPATVFSAEHWNESVHDWVCYAAPLHDVDGRVIGALDLSATWTQASTLAKGTVQTMARLVDRELAARHVVTDGATLDIRLLGNPRVRLRGREIALPLRQLEILAVLAIEGECSLDTLHARVYGDRAVSPATLKGEISLLRKALGGAIGSRPYRLTVPFTVDAGEVDQAIRHGSIAVASSAYRGQLLVSSDAPSVVTTRHQIDVGLRTALLGDGTADQLLTFAEVHPYDDEIIDTARRRADSTGDVALAARLAAAEARRRSD